ncbi:ATP-binding protein [Streptomyces sp. NEAU-PBA10]|uniref:ATP-binding protein n=1 Tax=Streptomyces TaxID=1883 RepID=UPI0038CF9C2B
MLIGLGIGLPLPAADLVSPANARHPNHPHLEPAPTGHPAYTETLPCTPDSAPAARRLIRQALGAWALDGLADDACLVAGEMVANACRHTRSPVIRVSVTRLDGPGVEIAVTDRSRALPIRKPSRPDALDGRGLVLVDAIAARWGADPKRWGKRIWAEVRAA